MKSVGAVKRASYTLRNREKAMYNNEARGIFKNGSIFGVKKQESAITLIALVLTIVVLLILAGITLNAVIGENGILDKSKTAANEYKIAQYKERIEIITAGEQSKKIIDNLPKSLKDLVVERLESEENAYWVKTVKTTEEDSELEENQIKVITQDKYIIVAEIEDGKVTFITIEIDNGEPYPSLEAEVMPLEGQDDENVKIKVKAEVEKTSKTTKIEKIELIKEGTVKETKNYNELKVEDTFEVEENGIYRIKATTNQGKSTSRKVEVNVQSIESSIQISAEPTTETARNTENPGTKNGIETGPIIVTIEYEEIGLKKQYSIDGENWTNVEESSVKIPVTENIRVRARYTDEINSYKLVKYDVQNVDNVAPTFTKYDATVKGTTITATGEATDKASEGAKSGIEGILKYEYSIDGENYQNENTFTVTTSGNYTIYIKAIDKAGNETIVSKTLEVTIYTLTYDANGGTDAPEIQQSTDGKYIISKNMPIKKNCVFVGWGLTAKDKEASCQPGESYYYKGERTLYAIWKSATYAVSSSSNQDEESISIELPNYVDYKTSSSGYYSVGGSWDGHPVSDGGSISASEAGTTSIEKVNSDKEGYYILNVKCKANPSKIVASGASGSVGCGYRITVTINLSN